RVARDRGGQRGDLDKVRLPEDDAVRAAAIVPADNHLVPQNHGVHRLDDAVGFDGEVIGGDFPDHVQVAIGLEDGAVSGDFNAGKIGGGGINGADIELAVAIGAEAEAALDEHRVGDDVPFDGGRAGGLAGD